MAEYIEQSILNKLRKDKFILVLDLPPALKPFYERGIRTNDSVNLNKLQFSVYGTMVPEISIPPINNQTRGQPYQVTSQQRPEYQPISVKFTIDNGFENYWVLWKWLEIMNDPKESVMPEEFADYTKTENATANPASDIVNQTLNRQGPSSNIKYKHLKMKNFFTDYQTTIVAYVLREYNEKIAKITYTNAFITNLGGIEYNHRDVAEIETSFTFAFNQLHIDLLEPGTETIAGSQT